MHSGKNTKRHSTSCRTSSSRSAPSGAFRSLHGKYTHPRIGTQEKFKDSLRDLRLRLPAGAASRVLTLLAAQAKQFSHTVLVQLFS